MSRADGRDGIFLDDVDRQGFRKTLAEACPKTIPGACILSLVLSRFYLATGLVLKAVAVEKVIDVPAAELSVCRGKGLAHIFRFDVTVDKGAVRPPAMIDEGGLLFDGRDHSLLREVRDVRFRPE